MADKQVYPRIPEANWWTIRKKFNQTIPSKVDAQYLMTLLGLNSKKAAQNLISPLRQMRIIDDQGKPLPRANDWRSDQKYADVCADIVTEIYPPQLNDLFPEIPEDTSQIKNWFMSDASLGDKAASQTTLTFVMLKTATVKNETVPPQAGTKKKTTANPSSKKQPTHNVSMPPNANTLPPVNAARNNAQIDLVVHLHFTENITSEQVDCIFASMKKHLLMN